MPSKQQTFDLVARALLAQGGPSMSAGMCKYRGDCGRKCAAGWLIPDSKYDPDLEGVSIEKDPDAVRPEMVDSTMAKAIALAQIMREEGHDLVLVHDLQTAHDNAVFNSGDWDMSANFSIVNQLRRVAREHDLSTEALG